MTSSYKLALLFIIPCLLLSLHSQNVEGQLPGIRWGRGFQEGNGFQRESKGKLWGLVNKRIHQLQLSGKILCSLKFILLNVLILRGHKRKRQTLPCELRALSVTDRLCLSKQ